MPSLLHEQYLQSVQTDSNISEGKETVISDSPIKDEKRSISSELLGYPMVSKYLDLQYLRI